MTGNTISRSGPAQATERSPSSAGADQTRQPEGESIDRFRKAFHRKEDGEKDQDRHPPQQEMAASLPQFATGDSILRAMQGTAKADTKPVAEVQQKTDALVDRILVSADKVEGTSEVRIRLRDDILPGTEITIRRDAESVHVNLVTTDNSAHAFLNEHRQGLETQLAQRMEGKVTVELSYDEHDGRSRQQRNLYDEQEQS